jgi:hypothetical protein
MPPLHAALTSWCLAKYAHSVSSGFPRWWRLGLVSTEVVLAAGLIVAAGGRLVLVGGRHRVPRSGGRVTVVAAVQDPRKETIPARDLFRTRIGLRLNEAEQIHLVLGPGARDPGAHCDTIPDNLSGAGVWRVAFLSQADGVFGLDQQIYSTLVAPARAQRSGARFDGCDGDVRSGGARTQRRLRQSELSSPQRDCWNDPPHTSM